MSNIAVLPSAGRTFASGESDLTQKPPWTEFLGLPAGGKLALEQQIDPYQRFPRETLHLPEVYRGHNPYLSQVRDSEILIVDERQRLAYSSVSLKRLIFF